MSINEHPDGGLATTKISFTEINLRAMMGMKSSMLVCCQKISQKYQYILVKNIDKFFLIFIFSLYRGFFIIIFVIYL